MTTQIDIIAPASVSLLGSILTSPDPAALSVNNPAGGTTTITITAGNAAAWLSASSAGGAAVSNNANTLTLSGTGAQVNTALASLELSDTGADVLNIIASSAGAVSAVTAIAVSQNPASGPAFAAPPATVALSPYVIGMIGGLVLGDPAASALAAAGLGESETMAVTLSVASGVLLLPALSPLSGIAVSGIGTAQVLLTFTADQLAAVNALLASLEFAGPAAISGLAYAARDVSGPLGATVTSGNIVLNIAGTQGPFVSLNSGGDTAILGLTSLSPGNLLSITSQAADIGGINGQGALFIAPAASLEVPYNALSLGGTSDDFGTLGAAALNETGALLAGNGGVFAGPINLGSAGEIDFTGSLAAGAADGNAGDLDISLGQAALITGSGNLVAGNFSESGIISGPGTILAGAGDTLVIAAGQISGATLEIAGGGVLELGAIDPLYGVFDATALTVGPNVSLSFLNDSGSTPTNGAFADTLGQSGGVIVITSPNIFAGHIVNFAAGDRLIFPGLTGLTLSSITSAGFVVSGPDASGITQSYTINAAIAAGMSPFVGTDINGDGEVSLRNAQPDVFFAGTTINVSALVAQPGSRQPLTGLEILPRSWNGQSLTVTLSVSHGILSGPGITASGQITLTAASPTALDVTLQTLTYDANANALNDQIRISSASGVLNGLLNFLQISINNAGGATAGYFGDAAQAAIFTDTSPVPVQAIGAPGALIVTGNKIFDTSLDISGLSGTALQIAGNASAVFDSGSVTYLAADATIASAGLLGVLSDAFSLTGNISVAGSMIISGAVTATGNLDVSGAVAASGILAAAAASIATSGLLRQSGGSEVFGTLTVLGELDDFNASTLAAGTAMISGLLALGGTATFISNAGVSANGTIIVGSAAVFEGSTLSQTGGSILLAGLASFADVTAGGLILLGGGTLLSPSLSLQPGAVLEGGGVVGAPGSLGAMTVNGGTILATGNLLLADDVTLSNGGVIAIAGTSALGIVHAVSGGTISFQGPDAVLTINDVSQFSAAVTGMLDHDVIDLIGVAPSLVTFGGGEITAGNGQFALGVAAGQPPVSIISDGSGGSLITLGGDMACFARGTRLLTPNGYRPVEGFAPGDPVITYAGERRAVRWLGWRTLDLSGYDKARPVLFAPNALAPGVPKRPVCLSPLHAVFIGGVLVPACHLVNGATITTLKPAAVTYYHIELDRHDILLADGMAAESYLDTGNRGQLYTELGIRGGPAAPYARLVTGGPELAAIRRRLHRIALDAGFSLTYRASLRGVTDDASVMPRKFWRHGRREWRFTFATPVTKLGLAAPSTSPADTDPDSDDRRQLSLCLAGLPAGVTLGQGWFAKAGADAGIWMQAGAQLGFATGARTDLTLSLAAIIQTWVPPAPTLMTPHPLT